MDYRWLLPVDSHYKLPGHTGDAQDANYLELKRGNVACNSVKETP